VDFRFAQVPQIGRAPSHFLFRLRQSSHARASLYCRRYLPWSADVKVGIQSVDLKCGLWRKCLAQARFAEMMSLLTLKYSSSATSRGVLGFPDSWGNLEPPGSSP
jgi:hypothetical protein